MLEHGQRGALRPAGVFCSGHCHEDRDRYRPARSDPTRSAGSATIGSTRWLGAARDDEAGAVDAVGATTASRDPAAAVSLAERPRRSSCCHSSNVAPNRRAAAPRSASDARTACTNSHPAGANRRRSSSGVRPGDIGAGRGGCRNPYSSRVAPGAATSKTPDVAEVVIVGEGVQAPEVQYQLAALPDAYAGQARDVPVHERRRDPDARWAGRVRAGRARSASSSHNRRQCASGIARQGAGVRRCWWGARMRSRRWCRRRRTRR